MFAENVRSVGMVGNRTRLTTCKQTWCVTLRPFLLFFFLTFYKISCIYFYQRKLFWRILDWYSFVIILHFVHFHVCSVFMRVLPWCSLTRFAERKAAVQPTGFSADEEDAENTNSDKEGHENNRSYGQTYESTNTAKGEKRKRWINEQRIDDEEGQTAELPVNVLVTFSIRQEDAILQHNTRGQHHQNIVCNWSWS